MKAFLTFIIVLLLGLTGWIWHFKTRPTEEHRAIIAGLEAELNEAVKERNRLHGELVQVKAELARKDGEGEAAPGTDASPTVQTRPPDQQRLEELKAIHDRNVAEIEKERVEAERVLAEAKEQHKKAAEAKPEFSEHRSTTATNPDGTISFSGNRGIRTSKADRERLLKGHQEQLDRLAALVEAASAKIAAINERRKLLDQQYRNAVLKAQTEATGTGQ